MTIYLLKIAHFIACFFMSVYFFSQKGKTALGTSHKTTHGGRLYYRGPWQNLF